MREFNLLKRGNINLLVPKSEVWSAEATLSNFNSFDSTISVINISARSRCLIPLVRRDISDTYTHNLGYPLRWLLGPGEITLSSTYL